MSPNLDHKLELWAGVECTLNRVGDAYSDQLERSGHANRDDDTDRLAELGIKSVRYPVLWERTAPDDSRKHNWSWSDERLACIRRSGINPIVGLVHHGSGPRYTSLLDPEFPEKLAAYAGAVAERYPWVTDYTPVNEPLTTARFSCLYGHWYPHDRDPLNFARALIAQCRAVVLAMKAIRKVNTGARLLQTEDLGKTVSTPALVYQAEFENHRRWLTYDLLCGAVVPGSPMWEYFTWLGVQRNELDWFIENPHPPDILGVNHYVTSERFLDERINRYPARFHGGNGRHVYADVEAVRVCAEGVAGPSSILREVWDRYQLPIAITEVHLGCTREEQLRWLNEVWNAAVHARETGVDVRAVTPWAAFGAFDWNSLLTREEGHYEPGVFDVRSPSPRATALSGWIKAIAAGEAFDHPVLDTPGWWHRLDRLCYPPVSRKEQGVSSSVRTAKTTGKSSRPILITGATGTLGQAFARICAKRGLAYYLLSREELDIANEVSVSSALDMYQPWVIINTAGYVRVDEAETEVDKCHRENVSGPVILARECERRGLRLVTFSSDLVFDGRKQTPYVESDQVAPLNVYGASKAKAETQVLDQFPGALVIRTSAFFGPWDRYNFAHLVLQSISDRCRFRAANDETISPTYIPALVNAALDLLIDNEQGIWHLTNQGALTWADFARLIAANAGYDAAYIQDCAGKDLASPAIRPAFSALISERGNLMPSIDESVARFLDDYKWDLGNELIPMARANF
jgi:dTDP-4-dehydrorhamnose reductase